MASGPTKARCIKCGKEKATSKCGGCLEDFCYKHLGDHRQELSKQLDEIEVTRDLFRQTINEQKSDPQKYSLIQQIDQWEQESIKKIRQTADEARKSVAHHVSNHFMEIEFQLNKLTDQLRQSREEEDFFESDLRQWNQELTELTEQLEKPSNITLQRDSTSLINKISIKISTDKRLLGFPNIQANTKWIENGITIVGGNGRGDRLDQLNGPCGIFVDSDQTVYVADSGNNRIVEWKYGVTKGHVVAGGNGKGNGNHQLSFPTNVIVDKQNDCLVIADAGNRRVIRWPLQTGTTGKMIISDIDCHGLAMDNHGYLYVTDIVQHEVKRWKIGDKNGVVVAGGNRQGNRLNQLGCPHYVFVDDDRSVYVSDWNNHRIMKWMEGAKEGILIAGGQGEGNNLSQFWYPRGIVVDQLGTVYVVDNSNHRIMKWFKGSTEGNIIIGRDREGKQANQLSDPTGLSFDSQGNLYILDCSNYRVQKFNIHSNLVS